MDNDPNAQQYEELAKSREHTLEPKSEYRFELDPEKTLAIQVLSGRAEIFGAELALNRTYLFGSECKAAIYTWHGCTIEVTAEPSTEYVSNETPLVPYSNLHLAFEKMRIKNKQYLREHPEALSGSTMLQNSSQGMPDPPPRVMIIGPENSGKTSATKTLINYATRVGRVCTPVLVSVDPSEGGWTVPGTLSAAVISSPIPTSDPVNPFGPTSTSAPTSLTSSALLPIVYWYGHTETRRNQPLYEQTIRNLAASVRERMQQDAITKNSGLYIDTPSSFAVPIRVGTEMRYPLAQQCVEEFGVNVIVVIGHEKLNVEMQKLFSSSSRKITVIKVPKSGGVVELDHHYRSRVINHQIRNYFYGTPLPVPPGVPLGSLGGEGLTELTLSPYASSIKFEDLKIYRFGAETMAPSSALPIGASRVLSELQPARLDLAFGSSGVLNAVLALLPIRQVNGQNSDEDYTDEELLTQDIIGFILVTAIDMVKKRMTVLSPNPGSLVGRTAIIGSLEWQDQ